MKRQFVVLALLACAAACGTDPKVVVRASLTPGGEPIADLPVQLLPYDREELLDSLAEAADDPEPALPQEVLQEQQERAGRGDRRQAPRDSLPRQGGIRTLHPPDVQSNLRSSF